MLSSGLVGAVVSLCTVLALAASPSQASGQEVRGTLVSASDGEPIAGALVALHDSAGAQVVNVITSEDGTYRLRAPEAGTYFIRVQRIGFRTWSSDPFRLRPAEIRSETHRISVAAVELSELHVAGERQCRTDPEEGTLAASLRQEALKALEALRWSQKTQPYRFTVVERVRHLDQETLHVLSQESVESETVSGMLPYASIPATRLHEDGYVQNQEGETVYYGPDAQVLLSDVFWANHCFETMPGPDGSGLIGLAFSPVPGREKPDISGVLWLDRDSVRLENLEFNYTEVPGGATGEHIGGEIHFEQLSNGGWILRKWALRIPVIGRSQSARLPGMRHGQGEVRSITRIREVSGEVTEIERRYESLGGIRESEGVAITGQVYDSLRGAPLADARIVLPDLGLSDRTDEEGWFSLSGLPAGEHRIEVAHPVFEALGLDRPGTTVWARPRKVYDGSMRLPSRETLIRRTCGSATEDRTVVAGRLVNGSSGQAISDATVYATAELTEEETAEQADEANEPQRTGRQLLTWRAQSDEAGYYRLCGMPANATVSFRIMASGFPTLRQSHQLDEDTPFWEYDFLLQPPDSGAR